jgi:hypothetical protein
MGIGVQAEVTDHDLAFVWNMRGDARDELQIIHPLLVFGLFPIPVADLALLLREREALQRKERPNHVFAHPLRFFLGRSLDFAVDREAGMVPACDHLHDLRADELFPKEKSEDLALIELGQQTVLQLSDTMKRALAIFTSLCLQAVDVRMGI